MFELPLFTLYFFVVCLVNLILELQNIWPTPLPHLNLVVMCVWIHYLDQENPVYYNWMPKDPKGFPRLPRHLIFPVCLQSSPGSPHGWTSLKLLAYSILEALNHLSWVLLVEIRTLLWAAPKWLTFCLRLSLLEAYSHHLYLYFFLFTTHRTCVNE